MIETEHLKLREFHRSDMEAVYELYSKEEEYYKHTRIPWPYTMEDADEFIQSTYMDDRAYMAVIDKESGKLIGGLSLRFNKEDDSASIGYSIAPAFAGKGYATEAARVFISHAFSQLGLHRIEITCSVDNKASQRIIEKLGAKFEGTLRQAVKTRAGYEDKMVFGLLKGEWKE